MVRTALLMCALVPNFTNVHERKCKPKKAKEMFMLSGFQEEKWDQRNNFLSWTVSLMDEIRASFSTHLIFYLDEEIVRLTNFVNYLDAHPRRCFIQKAKEYRRAKNFNFSKIYTLNNKSEEVVVVVNPLLFGLSTCFLFQHLHYFCGKVCC